VATNRGESIVAQHEVWVVDSDTWAILLSVFNNSDEYLTLVFFFLAFYVLTLILIHPTSDLSLSALLDIRRISLANN
jgi:hypothetical protein